MATGGLKGLAGMRKVEAFAEGFLVGVQFLKCSLAFTCRFDGEDL